MSDSSSSRRQNASPSFSGTGIMGASSSRTPCSSSTWMVTSAEPRATWDTPASFSGSRSRSRSLPNRSRYSLIRPRCSEDMEASFSLGLEEERKLPIDGGLRALHDQPPEVLELPLHRLAVLVVGRLVLGVLVLFHRAERVAQLLEDLGTDRRRPEADFDDLVPPRELLR